MRRLTRPMMLAVAALARGETVPEIAEKTRGFGRKRSIASKSTLYRWLQRPEFVAALDRLIADRAESVAELRRLINDPTTPPMVKYKAAATLAEMAREPERSPDFNGSLHDERIVDALVSIRPEAGSAG